jgi:hypothetical protein
MNVVESTKYINNSRIDKQEALEENRINSFVHEQFLKGYCDSDAIYEIMKNKSLISGDGRSFHMRKTS